MMIRFALRDPWLWVLLLSLGVYLFLSSLVNEITASKDQLEQEVSQLHNSVTRLRGQTDSSSLPTPKNDLYLSSLLYIDDDHWTVWVNEKPVRVGEEHDLHEFTLISVNKDRVSIDYGGQLVELKPHQTYRPDERRVLNGDKRRNETSSD